MPAHHQVLTSVSTLCFENWKREFGYEQESTERLHRHRDRCCCRNSFDPGIAGYVFTLTQGTGVDANGDPIISVNPTRISGRNVTFTVAPGDPSNQGVITTLNTTTIDAASGAAVTDTLGIVTIGVSLDGYGSWKITAVVAPDTSGDFGGSETIIMITR